MSRKYTLGDVAVHDQRDNLWMAIHNNVVDLTQFIHEHPGGEEVLVDHGGKDASAAFEDVGHSPEARQLLDSLTIGVLEKQAGEAVVPKTAPLQPPTQNHGWFISSKIPILVVGISLAVAAYSVVWNAAL